MSAQESAMLKQAEEEADDRIQCKFCNRKFNENAAERHITFCEMKTKKDEMRTGKPAVTKSKQPAPTNTKRTTGANFGKR